MNHYLAITLTLCLCCLFSVSQQQQYVISNVYSNTTTCSNTPVSIVFQTTSCQSGTYAVCGSTTVQEFKCSGANCTTCTPTTIPVNRCIPNTTNDYSVKISCGSFALPSGYAATAEYTSNTKCAGSASTVVAYKINECFLSTEANAYLMITCTSTVIKATKCSDSSCSKDCESQAVPVGCEPAGGDASVNFMCSP